MTRTCMDCGEALTKQDESYHWQYCSANRYETGWDTPEQYAQDKGHGHPATGEQND